MPSITKPRVACLIGWPAAHSRSPLIHHYWLRKLGIEGGYSIEAIPPEGFAEFVSRLSAHGFVGANVTLPHKERALELSVPDARARAVVFGLIERGIGRVHLANRTIERAQALADQFGARVHPVAWDGIGDLLPGAGVLVNTTSLGMHGQPALELDAGRLPSHAIVADLVYVPLETQLLAAARKRGLKTADGLGMLLHQAVRGFELWFGQRPEVTPALRALVEADLTADLTKD
jgi:shikimate dehydrogenase